SAPARVRVAGHGSAPLAPADRRHGRARAGARVRAGRSRRPRPCPGADARGNGGGRAARRRPAPAPGRVTGRPLPLAHFRPRTQLPLPVHEVPRPRFPVVDVHNHLGPTFGGNWTGRPPAELFDALDAAGVERIVDLDGGSGDALSRTIDHWQGTGKDRVIVFAGPSFEAWPDDP